VVAGGVVDGPLAECSSTVADRGDLNVHLSCRIRCKPPLTALFWIIDDRGTTVSDGQIVGEYWVLVQVQSYFTGGKADLWGSKIMELIFFAENFREQFSYRRALR